MIGKAAEKTNAKRGPGLMRDLVVVLPGITGSVLCRRGVTRDSQVWGFSAETMSSFLVRQGKHLGILKVPEHDPRSGAPDAGIAATGLISGFHGIYGMGRLAGYSKLTSELVKRFGLTPGNAWDNRPANLIEFPYDWRLSSRHNAALLRDVVNRRLAIWRKASGEPGAKVILIAHSMGGLVARYYLEVTGDDDIRGDGQWRKCRALFTFGTPFRGSVNAVNYVANGYKKLFLDLTDVVRSCPSIYELMPVYPAIEKGGAWYRPSEVDIPNAYGSYTLAARDFHDDIKVAIATHKKETAYLEGGYLTLPFVGVGQSTLQSAHLDAQALTSSETLPMDIDPLLDGGDGTVPVLSATPIEMSGDYREAFVSEQHGFLHSNLRSLEDLVERLKRTQSRGLADIQGSGRSPFAYINLRVDELFSFDEPVLIRARLVDSQQVPIPLVVDIAKVEAQRVDHIKTHFFQAEASWQRVELKGLEPGQYRITVRRFKPLNANLDRVHAAFEILGGGGEES